jgi:hypothetical protein
MATSTHASTRLRAPRLLWAALALVACAEGTPDVAHAPSAASPPPPAARWTHLWPEYGGFNYVDTNHGVAASANGELIGVTQEWLTGTAAPLTRWTVSPGGALTGAAWSGVTGTSAADRVSVADGNGDGVDDVILIRTLLSDDVEIVVLDSQTEAVLEQVTTSGPLGDLYLEGAWVRPVQLDADPPLEWIASNSVQLDDTGAFLQMVPFTGMFVPGPPVDVTGDQVPDLFGDDGGVLDGRTLQPTTPLPLASDPVPPDISRYWAVDADGDGDQDLLAHEGWAPGGRWFLVDGVTLQTRWSVRLADEAASPLMMDIDRDGTSDLLMGLSDPDDLLLWLDPQTGAELGRLPRPTPTFDATGMVAWDLDTDGDEELLVSVAHGQSVYDPGAGWTGVGPAAGGDRSLAVGDVDGTGEDVWVVITPPSSAARGVADYLRLDGQTGQVEDWFIGPAGKTRTRGALIVDEDGDGVQDLVVTAEGGGWAIPMAGGVPGVPRPIGLSTEQLGLANVDGDGVPDIVGSQVHYGGVQLHRGGQPGLAWAVLADERIETAVAADIDGDGRDEILAAVGQQGVWVLDGLTGAVRTRWPAYGLYMHVDVLGSGARQRILFGATGTPGRYELARLARVRGTWQTVAQGAIIGQEPNGMRAIGEYVLVYDRGEALITSQRTGLRWSVLARGLPNWHAVPAQGGVLMPGRNHDLTMWDLP